MRKIQFILFGFCMLLYWNCSNDKEEWFPTLDLAQQEYTVENDSGTVVVDITSNGDWTLESRSSWCRPQVKQGNGNARVNVKVAANLNTTRRVGRLVLKGQEMQREISISQSALILDLESLQLVSGLEGGTFQVKVFANAEWKVKSEADWFSIDRTSGQDSGYFNVKVKPVTVENGRIAEISVSSGVVVRTIKLIQGRLYDEGEVRIYRPEDAGNPVKLVFMGDGFIEEDLWVNGAYDQAMDEAIEAFLATEPYQTYRNYFCPYIVYAYSKERGMSTRGSDDKIKVKKETAFSVDMKEGTTLMNANMDQVLEYAKKVPGLVTTKTSIVVAVNDSRYAGTCYHWGNGQTVSLVPMNRELRPPGGFAHLITHEGAGHGFGRLADEYTGNGAITEKAIKDLEQSHKSGQFLNVTALKDPATVYWSDFIDRPGYEVVGFYKGAYTYGEGAWRCEDRNCMVDNIFYFSVACRLAIVKRLKEIAGEAFSLEDFIARDVQKAPTPGQLIGTRSFSPDYYPAPTPPILVRE